MLDAVSECAVRTHEGRGVGEVLNFDGASINFRESVSMVPLSTFVETFAKFAQISLKKKGRGVSEGPRREKNSETSQNTTPF